MVVCAAEHSRKSLKSQFMEMVEVLKQNKLNSSSRAEVEQLQRQCAIVSARLRSVTVQVQKSPSVCNVDCVLQETQSRISWRLAVYNATRGSVISRQPIWSTKCH